ncbi:MAG: ATP-binding protein [Gemmatimonadetes bacterium]|nr:ATP-binding protein [Gemmatimonadota bacterium]
MNKIRRRRTIHAFLALALGALGLAINQSPLFVSGGLHLQLGQIPALIAALIAGPAAGLVASGIANLTALMDPNGGLVAWVLVAEAATVGALMMRGRSPYMADLLFWACVGAPALGVIHLASDSSLWFGAASIAFQLAAAGYNILFAGLIALATRDLLGQTTVPMRAKERLDRQLFGFVALMTLLRVLSVAGFSARTERAEAIAENDRDVIQVASRLDLFLFERGHTARELAALFADSSHSTVSGRGWVRQEDSTLRALRLDAAFIGTEIPGVTVVDARGRILYSGDPARHQLLTPLAAAHIVTKNRDDWRHPAVSGVPRNGRYMGSTATTTYGWTVLAETPTTVAMHTANEMGTVAVLLSVASLIVVLLTLRLWTNAVTRPLRTMSEFIRNRDLLPSGDAPAPVMAPDEEGQPIEVLQMQRALMESDARAREEVSALSDSVITLDQQVAERTASLVEALERSEAASAAKSAFLSNTSHELRTPLNVILWQAVMLDEGILGTMRAQQHAALGEIAGQGRHLLDLIGDLLDVSRIENGRMALAIADVELSALLTAVRGMFDGDASERRLNLLVEVPERPHVIRADPLRLRQVLINLLSNAMKFTSATGSVEVRLEWAADGTTPLAILVRDTGIGIPDEAIERVFSAFEQVHSGLSRANNGAGLGLAISRQLCELMGMTLTLKSELGVGSCFRVGLATTESA